MSMSELQWEFLQDVAKLITFAKDQGYKLTGGELWRTEYQQEKYRKDGASKVSKSQHQKRLAIDVNLFVDGKIQWSKDANREALGAYWLSLNDGNRWGGNYESFSDPYHFERIG